MPNTVLVHVYTSPDKTSLIEVVPIIDGGVMTNRGHEPQSDEGLIHITKYQLRGQRRASDEEIENFHYEVERR